MKKESAHERVVAAAGDGWIAGGNFFASIMTGFLLGFLADKWLGTDPTLTVIGIILGSISGFYTMIAWSKEQEKRGR